MFFGKLAIHESFGANLVTSELRSTHLLTQRPESHKDENEDKDNVLVNEEKNDGNDEQDKHDGKLLSAEEQAKIIPAVSSKSIVSLRAKKVIRNALVR